MKGVRRLLAQQLVRRAALACVAVVVLPLASLVATSFAVALPAELAAASPVARSSVRLLDRDGALLAEVRADDGARARATPLDELGEPMVAAMLAAEDRRFFEHFGIDPIAMARAAAQAVVHRRIVSGASTLTQQLARLVVPRPRTVLGKLREMAIAMRIERALDKRRILEEYLNRAPFGPGVRGAPAACRRWLDKPCRDLSLAEAATIASLPRGPTLYDPRKGTERVLRRRDRVLARMRAAGLAPEPEIARALAEPLRIAVEPRAAGAPHFARALLAGELDPRVGREARPVEVQTTLDARLQRVATEAARAQVRALAERRVTAAAVVAIENASGEVLAWVGSPDVDDAARLGANDGVRAARQPGSALKPFVYELAMERLGMTTATVLPDVELHLGEGGGDFAPHDYDGRFHGPVRLREALASSYNVPAVWTAAMLGPDRLLARLRALGFASLREDAARYGAALALGDGEVTLLELAGAYATLARGGVALPTRFARAVRRADGEVAPAPASAPMRVLDATRARLVADVLADDKARIAAFGEGSALALPFPAAAKTGTSKGFRDNVAVGYTSEVTVAVWVGNFDGSPMQAVSGITGAGPLLRDVLVEAMRGRVAAPLAIEDDGADARADGVRFVEVCSLSGALPGDACPHRRREPFAPGTEPRARCAMHERVRVDVRDGGRAGAACADADVAERVYERYDAPYAAWARAAGRPLAPSHASSRCPPGSAAGEGGAPPALVHPLAGARYLVDPSLAADQSLLLRARAASGTRAVRFVVDGASSPPVAAPFAWAWRLVPGPHRLAVVDDAGRASEPVTITVD